MCKKNIFYMTCCLLNVTDMHPVPLCTNAYSFYVSQLDKNLNLPDSLHVYQHHGLVAK